MKDFGRSAGIAVFVIAGVFCVSAVKAQDQQANTTAQDQQAEAQEWKAQVDSAKQSLQAQKDQIQTNAQAAKEGEKALRDQITQARESGDQATAQSLRSQLKTTHQANVEQRKQDTDALKSARQELKTTRKNARFDRDDANDDGAVDRVERVRARRNGKK